MRAILAAIAIVGTFVVLTFAPAKAANGGATAKWDSQAIINMSLTPNYTSGFGSVKAAFGTQPTPVTGPNAALQGGSVDFGQVVAGNTYLYKYAAHLTVTSNDLNGFAVYAEGAADFYNTSDGTSQTLNQTLYYLPSSASNDANTGFSAAFPFYRTTNAVTGGAYAAAASIAYAAYPAPISQPTQESTDLYYDFQLKVPAAATSGLYYVWVVYTVVAK